MDVTINMCCSFKSQFMFYAISCIFLDAIIEQGKIIHNTFSSVTQTSLRDTESGCFIVRKGAHFSQIMTTLRKSFTLLYRAWNGLLISLHLLDLLVAWWLTGAT